jgi:hypothetical protein
MPKLLAYTLSLLFVATILLIGVTIVGGGIIALSGLPWPWIIAVVVVLVAGAAA